MDPFQRAKKIQEQSIEKLRDIKEIKEHIRLKISIIKTRVRKKGLEEEANGLAEIEESLL